MITFGDPAQLVQAAPLPLISLPPAAVVGLAAPDFIPSAAQPWLSIDIETRDGRPEEIERWLRIHYTPPADYETAQACGKHLLDMRAARKKKSALLDGAPIVVVTVQTPVGLYGLHALGEAPATIDRATGGELQGFANARQMLLALRNGLEANCDRDTVIAGHNILSFDLPKLRLAFVKAGLRMPGALASYGQPKFDTMREFGRHFSQVEKPFVALADLLEEFDIPSHKGEMDGSKVPGMVEEILAGGPNAAALRDQLITYALKDAAVEARLYLAMTGQLPDQPTTAEALGV